MKTSIGHVWRVKSSEKGGLIASYIARDGDSIAITEEGMTAITEIIGESDVELATWGPKLHEQALQPFIRDYNVWAREADGQESQLSTSGTKENHFDHDRLHRSPDGCFVIVSQYTPEQKHTVYQIESSPKDQIQPRLKEFQYLKPGDKPRIERSKIFDLLEKKEVTTDDTLFQNPYRIRHLGWSADSREYRFQYYHRGRQVLRAIGMDTQGSVRSIIEETSKTFIDGQKVDCYRSCSSHSNEIIWTSERDGWNHLYLFDLETGELKNQITQGEWVVHHMHIIAWTLKQIWFHAFGNVKGQDPYYEHYARVNFDGSGLTILTEDDGTHTWNWSPSNIHPKYMIDTWSRVDLPPQTVLRNAETGNVIMDFKEASVEKVVEPGWELVEPGWEPVEEPVERFAAVGRDGETMIYGIIIRPWDFDASKRYPVIEHIYGGPRDFSVPKAFSPLHK